MGERIWMLQAWLPDGIDRAELTDEDNVAFPNQDEVRRQLFGGGAVPPGMRSDPWPAASALEVNIAAPELAFDFWRSAAGPLVSARLREAWAAPADGVEYAAVDASGSCAEARAQDYRLMHVMAEAPVVDLAKSDYDTADQLDWVPKGLPFYVRSFAIRPDAAPPGPLFRDTVARNFEFCTDAAALRALLAGCTGVRFGDPATQRLLQPIRYRTIEGIAETGDYDVVAQRVEAHLVERIPLTH
ncbi:MAG: imm11 family protein [Methyloligellaceae bacterium]